MKTPWQALSALQIQFYKQLQRSVPVPMTLVHVINGEVALREKPIHTSKAKSKGGTVLLCITTAENAPWNSHHIATESPLCVKPVTLLL